MVRPDGVVSRRVDNGMNGNTRMLKRIRNGVRKMNEPVLVYSQQWPVAAALEALLARGNGTPVIPLYTKADLVCHLKDNPRIPLVFVLSPHEHVVDLYCLQPLLSGRPVLFVARRFYWTDCRLPAFCGLESYRCCTWDNLTDSFSRRMEMRYFQLMTADIPAVTSESAPVLTAEQIITRANQWLYREMENAGLSGYERMVLFLLSESRRSELSTRKLSYYKNSGLGKLGMSRHVINLYRGIKIRPVLQIRLF